MAANDGWQQVTMRGINTLEVYVVPMATEPSIGIFVDRGLPSEASYILSSSAAEALVSTLQQKVAESRDGIKN